MRLAISLVLSTWAAYAFSFAVDMSVGPLVGVYPKTVVFATPFWFSLALFSLFVARKVRNGAHCPLLCLANACCAVLDRRATHDLPVGLTPPPADWQIPFQALAEECRAPTDVAVAFAGVQQYLLEEVLSRRTER